MRYADAADAVPRQARVLHSLSPVDPDVALTDLWPAAATGRGLVRSATAYDFIPALAPERELAEPAARARYRVRLELIRSVHQLHVLSRAVALDARKLLDPGPRDVVVVGAAPPAWCVAPADRDAARSRALERVAGLDRPYVLYPTGSHPRKNNERLVRAWSRLAPPVRDAFQLVLAGDVPRSTADHYAHLARAGGVEAQVVTTGFVDDDLLLTLYQGAHLVCFPSLAEGFGLPVAEALACGTPVVVSDLPPLDELAGPEHRFAPTDEDSIARAIETHLVRGPASPSRGPSGAAPTWNDVATRTAAAFDALLSRTAAVRTGPRATAGPGRPRSEGARRSIAFVSPLPPAPTGVAAYSLRLVEELHAIGGVALDVFVDGPTAGQEAPPGVARYRARSLPTIELARGRYDAVVYALGNSHHHLGALAAMRRRRGTVVSHDVRLTNLYRHEHGDPGLEPGGLARAIRAMYGDALPDGLGRDGSVSDSELDRYGVLMSREAIERSDRFLVSSLAAARLASVDVGTVLSERVGVLPYAFEQPGHVTGFVDERAEPPVGLPAAVLEWWGAGPDAVPADVTVVTHFGIVDPAKDPITLLEAFVLAAPRLAGAKLAFVGPIADAIAAELAARAAAAGLAASLVITGPLAPDAYRAWTRRATVAVQLRRSSNGEASAAVGECLASGVPTVVSDLGWARELPDAAVVRVPARVDAASLARVLSELARDLPRRRSLAAAGRAEAGARSFARTAAALLELVGLGTTA